MSRHATTGPRTAGAIARGAVASGADLIVVAGGDGTVNEVVEGLAGSAIPVGVLPAGTANVLAREMGIRPGLERAAQRLMEFVPRRVSLGLLDRGGERAQHFLLMAGAGLDAHIVFRLNGVLKARLGKLAYWLCGCGEFGRKLEEFQVVIDGEAHLCSFALITKVRNYGGDFEIAPRVTLLDNQFEVVLFEGCNSWRYFFYLGAVATKRLERLKSVGIYRAREVTLLPRRGESVHLQVDGEYAGQLPASVRMIDNGVTLLMPRGYGA